MCNRNIPYGRYIVTAILLFFLVISGSSCGDRDKGAESTDANYKWELVNNGNKLGLDDVSMISETNIWAFSGTLNEKSHGGALYHYDGSNWNEVYSLENATLSRIYALDSQHIWAIGRGYENNGNDTYDAIFFYDGNSVQIQFKDYDSLFIDIFALDLEHVWVVGESTYFFDGNEWVEQDSASIEGNRVVASDPQHAWIQNAKGEVYFFNGQQWSFQAQLVSQEQREKDALSGPMCAYDEEHVWTTSLGVFPNPNCRFFSFDGSNWEEQGSLEASFRKMFVLDPSHIWAAGSDIVFYNGKDWTVQMRSAEVLGDIYAKDQSTSWAVGLTGNIYKGVREHNDSE